LCGDPVRCLGRQEVTAVQLDRLPVAPRRAAGIARVLGDPPGVHAHVELVQVEPEFVGPQNVAVPIAGDFDACRGLFQDLPQGVDGHLQRTVRRGPFAAGPQHLVELLAADGVSPVEQQVMEKA
jgi:hypothetical protein